MAKIIKRLNTVNKIDGLVEKQKFGNFKLGFGAIGHECLRALWYGFHWCSKSKIPARVKRIFRLGHFLEMMVIQDLNSAGIEVFRRDEDGNKIPLLGNDEDKQESLIGRTGHEKGKPDGRCLGVLEAPKTEHLLEIKSMKDSKFQTLLRVGLKEFDLKYWGQIHRCMKAMKLKRCLYIAINKDDCTYFIFRVNFDSGYSDDLVRKETIILTSYAPPDKAHPIGHYKCMYCNHRELCEGSKIPQINCRTCEHSDISNGGLWSCDVKGDGMDREIDIEKQMKGCKKYKMGWGLNE